MKKFKSKLKNQGGFTLVEMLIVVAIIAILVAVSIPLVNTSLEKAREATDAANERAAKMAVTVEFLMNGKEAAGTYYYNAETGRALKDSTGIEGYGKCKNHKDGYVQVVLADDGGCTILWVGSVTSPNPHGINVEKETTSVGG